MMNERFFRLFFRAAALYNLAAGAATILFPQLFFSFFGIPGINHEYVMRGLGMFVGIYGYGFYLVSVDLSRHRHFAVLGLAGKSLAVIGWLYYTVLGEIPASALWMNIFNDVVWIPFLLLYFQWLRKNSPDQPNNRL